MRILLATWLLLGFISGMQGKAPGEYKKTITKMNTNLLNLGLRSENSATPPPIDLLFVVDSSKNAGKKNYLMAMRFLEKLLESFSISPGTTRVGLITFSGPCETHLTFETCPNRECVEDKMLNVGAFYGGIKTLFGNALNTAANVFSTAFDRPGTTKLLVAVSNGFVSTKADGRLLNRASDRLEKLGVKRYVFSVGKGASAKNLRKVASKPKSNLFAFRHPDALTLIMDSLPRGHYQYCKTSGVTKDECGRHCHCVFGFLLHCERVRKEVNSMTVADRTLFIQTYIKLTTGAAFRERYNKFVYIHHINFRTNIHQAAQFLPWHRWFNLKMENLLKEVDCRVNLPYWDWSIVSHDAWDPNGLFGNRPDGLGGRSSGLVNETCVQDGPLGESTGWVNQQGKCLTRRLFDIPPDALAVQSAKLMTDFFDFETALRVNLHDTIHFLIGGHMTTNDSATVPEFFLHHSFVDKIWWDYQNMDQTRFYGIFNFTDLLIDTPFQIMQFMDNKNLPGNVKITFDEPTVDNALKVEKYLKGQTLSSVLKIKHEKCRLFDNKALAWFHVTAADRARAAKFNSMEAKTIMTKSNTKNLHGFNKIHGFDLPINSVKNPSDEKQEEELEKKEGEIIEEEEEVEQEQEQVPEKKEEDPVWRGHMMRRKHYHNSRRKFSGKRTMRKIKANLLDLGLKGKGSAIPPAIDLLFVVDSSENAGKENFVMTMEFLEKLLDFFSISPGTTRVGLITFNSLCETQFTFETCPNRKCVENRMLKAGALYGGKKTLFGQALNKAANAFSAAFNRPGTKKLLVAVSNGYVSTGADRTQLYSASNRLEVLGVERFVFSVGKGARYTNLQKVASNPKANLFVFRDCRALKLTMDFLPRGTYQYCKNSGVVMDECQRRCICVYGYLLRCERVRKEINSMTVADRTLFIQTYIKLTTNPSFKERYNKFIYIHHKNFRTNIHQAAQFFPWHRWFHLKMENLLKEVDCRVNIPYWDWSIVSQDAWNPNALFGNRPDGVGGRSIGNYNTTCVQDGPFGEPTGWVNQPGDCLRRRLFDKPPDALNVQKAKLEKDFLNFESDIRVNLHDTLHFLIGGQMTTNDSATVPEFFLHHGFVDKIWWEYQKMDQERFYGIFNFTDLLIDTSYQIRQLMDNKDLPGNVMIFYAEPTIDNALQVETYLKGLSHGAIFKIKHERSRVLDREAMAWFHVSAVDRARAERFNNMEANTIMTKSNTKSLHGLDKIHGFHLQMNGVTHPGFDQEEKKDGTEEKEDNPEEEQEEELKEDQEEEVEEMKEDELEEELDETEEVKEEEPEDEIEYED